MLTKTAKAHQKKGPDPSCHQGEAARGRLEGESESGAPRGQLEDNAVSCQDLRVPPPKQRRRAIAAASGDRVRNMLRPRPYATGRRQISSRRTD